MTSWITLLSKIETFCNAHLQIQKYGGEFREQMPNFSTKDEKYPIIYVEPVSDTEDLNTNQFTINIYCVDIIQKDRANINTIVSDCQLILKDIYVYYVNDNDPTLDVIGTATMTPLNNLDLDYVAGWVMSITFEVNSYGDCAIPMQPIPPPSPIECDPARLVILDTDGNQLYELVLASGSTNNQTIQDATWLLQNTVPTTLQTGSILAEGSATIEAPDASWELENTDGTALGGNNIPSGDNYLIIAPDGTAHIKHSQGGTIANLLIPSGATDEYTVADSNIEINGNYEFSIHATHTYDIRLKDQSNNTITPTSITSNPNHADIVINMAPPVGATLMKTNQKISYRTADDGDIEAGRNVDFFILPSPNPFGNTDRFTDILGGKIYATAIVIDWSTYNGSTVLGYSKNYFGLNDTWNTAIDGAVALSIGAFTTGWRLTNRRELQNIINEAGAATRVLNYAPFSISIDYNFWSSTTAQYDTTRAYILGSNSTGWVYALPKASAACSYIACRTFTVTGTILT